MTNKLKNEMIIVGGTLLIGFIVIAYFAETAPEFEELKDGSLKSIK